MANSLVGAWKEMSQTSLARPFKLSSQRTECHVKSFGWSCKLLKKAEITVVVVVGTFI